MVPPQAWAALFFGAFSALSCVIGAAIGVVWRPPQQAVAATMAFGAGALLAALAFELILPAEEAAGFIPVAIGSLIGGSTFIVLNEAVNSKGGFLRKPSTTARFVREQKQEEAEALLQRLSQVPLCRELPPEDLQAIVPHVEAVQYKQGERIYEQNQEADALYVIDQGQVDLCVSRRSAGSDGPDRRTTSSELPAGQGGTDAFTLARLGDGEAFGEVSLLTGGCHSASAVAATDAAVWRIPKEDFYCLLAVSPTLSQAVRELLARNLETGTGPEGYLDQEIERWGRIAKRYIEAHAVAPSPTELRQVAKEHAGSAPMGIFLGLLLDGIPESLVIGMSMIGQPTVSAALIAGLFLSNLPEAMSSAVGMKAQGAGTARILGMWTCLMVLIGVGAFIGNILFVGAPVALIAGFEAAAAGAMLTMIAQTALPEAYEQGGWLSGIATLLGFLAAFFVRGLGGGH